MADRSGTAVEAEVSARAHARHVSVTPMKARRVVDLIRGMRAEQALAVLKFAPQSASEPVYKVVASAVANARFTAERDQRRLDVEDLVVSEAYVDEGPTLKRFRPRAQGRAFRVRKRTSHITVVVAPRPPKARQATGTSQTAKTAKTSQTAKTSKTTPKRRTR